MDVRLLIGLMATQDRLTAMYYEIDDISRRFTSAGLVAPSYAIKGIKEHIGSLQDEVHLAMEKASGS